MRFAIETGYSIQIFADEVAYLLKDSVTKEIIETLVRECRKAGIGICLVSHFSGDVPDSISMHLDYEFIFRTVDKSLFHRLEKNYQFSKEQIEDIPKLKKFQCYAVGDFILYDSAGNKLSNDSKPVKILRIKPPNCKNSAEPY